MPTIAERFQTADNSGAPIEAGRGLDAGSLFNLAYDIYSGGSISTAVIENIEKFLPGNCLFFLTRGDQYLHPEKLELIPFETVRETIRNDTACIFRRQLYINRKINEVGCSLFCVSLGYDAAMREIAAGLIYSDNWSRTGLNEECMFGLLGQIRRFYDVFHSSRAVTDFMASSESFRYAVDSATGDIIRRCLPDGLDSSEAVGTLDRQVTKELIPAVLSNTCEKDDMPTKAWFKNLKISKISLLDYEYLFLSFRPSDSGLRNDKINSRLIGDFTHQLKGKLSAIKTAASQLSMQEGDVINEDDIVLLTVIDTAVQNADELLARFGRNYKNLSLEKNIIDETTEDTDRPVAAETTIDGQ